MSATSSKDQAVRLRHLRSLFSDQHGATAIEYGLIAALIVIAMLGAFGSVANVTSSMWNNVSTKVTNAR